MDFFGITGMLGGLALFLFGMKIMGDSLAKVSGGKMEAILQKLTSNQLKAVVLGAFVTAVVQSSSATTVMVVGFVNAGIMKLAQAIGIIMGANIGTTITAWILGLAGIESSNFFISLLKPSSFSPILAFIGIVMIMSFKAERKKDIGTIFIGFSILMTGMSTMSDMVKPLAEIPEFQEILVMFENPVFGIVAGAVLTAVIQSSSASVGILQALCLTKGVTFSSALPIIMGQNIGTCITAILSSIGTGKNAKRAALVHLYFNLIGTLVFMLGFYSINYFVHFAFLDDVATPWGIAVVHSIFNITVTLVLLPFSKLLEKFAYMTIPLEEEKPEVSDSQKELNKLDPLFLESPGYALDVSKKAVIHMANITKESVDLSIHLFKKFEKANWKQVVRIENEVDQFEDEVGTYLMKLSAKNLKEEESQLLTVLLHILGDIERISDHARSLAESAKEIENKKLSFTDKGAKELEILAKAVNEILDNAVKSIEEDNIIHAHLVEPLEEVIGQLRAEMKKRQVKRLRKEKCTIEMGFVFSDIITDYERIADHCSNIAVALIQLSENSYETHEYLEIVRQSDNVDFQGKVLAFSNKYKLP